MVDSYGRHEDLEYGIGVIQFRFERLLKKWIEDMMIQDNV